MWGVLAVCQVLAVGAQGFLLSLDRRTLQLRRPWRPAVNKDHEEGAKGLSQIFQAIGVGLPETSPGLPLQPSLFALTFAHTDTAGQNKQLPSLVVSWANGSEGGG